MNIGIADRVAMPEYGFIPSVAMTGFDMYDDRERPAGRHKVSL